MSDGLVGGLHCWDAGLKPARYIPVKLWTTDLARLKQCRPLGYYKSKGGK